jgi:hypothetical protein
LVYDVERLVSVIICLVSYPLPSHVKERVSILTPRVRRAQYELISALIESIKVSGLSREMAEAKLSALMVDVWAEVEAVARRLPGGSRHDWPKDIDQCKPHKSHLHDKGEINVRPSVNSIPKLVLTHSR